MLKSRKQVESRIRSLMWNLIHDNKWQDLDDFSLRLTDNLLDVWGNSIFSVQTIQMALQRTRTNFFVINRVKKRDFSQQLYSQFSLVDLSKHARLSNFEIVKGFVSKYLEEGYDPAKSTEERNQIIAKFGSIKNPHSKLMKGLETLFQKIAKSYQVSLHGTKEYSGVDISKKIEDATIGIQVKSINDDISEDKVRAQTSKALEYNFGGFVWIYGRPVSKDVTTSIQAAYHHFARINETKKTYCTLVHPELLAELFRKYAINLE